MRIKITSKDIKLVIKSAVMPKGSRALPILSYIKVVASPACCTWSSTDLECAAIYTAGIVEESGAALIPFKALQGLVKTAGAASRVITIESIPGNAGAMAARDGVYNTVIPCGVLEDYPEIPGGSAWPVTGSAKYTEAALADALGAVLPACSTEQTRYELQGVHIDADGLQATDGRRLHVYSLCAELKDGFIIHSNVMRRVLSGMVGAAVVDMTYSKNVVYLQGFQDMPEKRKKEEEERAQQNAEIMVNFIAGPLRLVSRCISGRFPNYKQVIPGNSAVPYALNLSITGTAELLAMLKGAPKRGCTVMLKLCGTREYTGLAYGYKTEIGEVSGVIELVSAICPDGYRIGLEARYLREALDGLGGYTLSLGCGRMTDDGACSRDAVKIMAGPFLAVLMPIALLPEARPADAVPVAAVEVLK